MSDMRLIVAGAGGRMGRTLVKAIAETKGLVLAGATEGAGSPLLGKDAGELAGIGANGVRWFALVRYDANRRVIWQGGRATDGTYWEWSAPPEHAGSGAGDPDLR